MRTCLSSRLCNLTCRSLLSLLTFLLCLQSVEPSPTSPGSVSSPDPNAGIRCDGELPDWHWNQQVLTRLPTTVQQLCAKSIYGGHPRTNLAGYCRTTYAIDRSPPSSSSGEPIRRSHKGVFFDRHEHSGFEHWATSDRAYLFCQIRCWCEGAGWQVHPVVQDAQVQMVESGLVADVNMNIEPTWGVFRQPDSTRTTGTLALQLNFRAQDERYADMTVKRILGLKAENKIVCDGPMFPWPLASPFATADFNSLQELCAAALSGGNSNGNAGGYCRNFRPFSERRDVEFSDELTPHTSFQYNNYPASVAVRVYCNAHCRCSGESEDFEWPPQPKLVSFLSSSIVDFTGNGISITPTYGERAGEDIVLIPKQKGYADGGSSQVYSGTCGSDGKQFCPSPWPTDLLGPKPHSDGSSDLEDFAYPKSTEEETCPSECGGDCVRSCQRNEDCGFDSTCRCVVPSLTAVSKQLGVDPVFPFAVCMTFAQYAVARGKAGTRYGRLGGRSLEAERLRGVYSFEVNETPACACNASYVSQSCCYATDGIVLEGCEEKMGILDG